MENRSRNVKTARVAAVLITAAMLIAFVYGASFLFLNLLIFGSTTTAILWAGAGLVAFIYAVFIVVLNGPLNSPDED